MTIKIGVTTQNNQTDAFVDQYDGGNLKIYTGSQPATADTSPSGTLLVTVTLPTPAFGSSSSGTAAKSGTWSASASGTGTAGWFRLQTSGNTKPLDGSVTVTGGGGNVTLDNVSITTLQVVTITAFNVTQPNT